MNVCNKKQTKKKQYSKSKYESTVKPIPNF